MTDRKIRALIVVQDSNISDTVLGLWNDSELFSVKAIFIANNNSYKFNYLKGKDMVEVLTGKTVINRLRQNDYDIIYFLSLSPRYYKFVNAIPEDRVVIWWMWGFDVYYRKMGLPPFFQMNLYKPLTEEYQKKTDSSLRRVLSEVRWRLLRPLMVLRRMKMLKRIDYFQPVLKLEYSMMQGQKYFSAKEFYFDTLKSTTEVPETRQSNGNILLGNSATPSNNHLDVLEILKTCRQKNQQIVIPLSYGDAKYSQWLKGHLDYPYIHAIYNFMPSEEYFKILDGCSYAVIGTVRQQALGNIYYAMEKGIKVFLYKDSVTYKTFRELGYAVYAIEEMTPESLRTPLTMAEILQNAEAGRKEKSRRNAVLKQFLKDMKERL